MKRRTLALGSRSWYCSRRT